MPVPKPKTMKNEAIEIAVAFTAHQSVWKNKKTTWSAFLQKLKTPQVKDITFKAFRQLTKADAGKLKDVGGYVGGYLRAGKRSPANVSYRQLLTLDIDFGTPDFWEAFQFVFDCEAVLHGTMSHEESAPRYRLLIPLSRECAADEYSAISRKVAGDIGIEFFDNTTFEVNRLMYWPTVCSDREYYFQHQAGEWLDADAVLESYRDWRDVSEWPTNKQSKDDIKTRADKQEDPLEKRGVIGAFCRAYTIEEAISTFLSKEYEEGTEGRYTYTKGSTGNGLVTYDNKFAYSHHGTDPASGMLCNAFDLVRLHKFGSLDNAPNSNASRKAMEAFAMGDKATKSLLARELKEAFASDFEDESGETSEAEEKESNSWLEDMDMDHQGKTFLSTDKNVDLILENDRAVKALFALNLFNNKPYLRKSATWRKLKHEEPVKNVDFSGLRNYISKAYGIRGKEMIQDSLNLEMARNAWHPIREYLNGLIWDQVQRVDTLFIEYFGAPDTIYTREAARKTLCGAVARVFHPGCKFDLMPVLVGEEGLYKSTFWKRLGKQWFSDTFFKVDGKDAVEQIQGSWIIEVAELAGIRKGEAEAVKHFITKQQDEYRPAYGHVREEYPRQCIFVGTTNQQAFLKDTTGNRRFLPIATEEKRVKKSVDLDLVGDEINQIWAEATFLFMQGEKLYLSDAAKKLAKEVQADHMEVDERAGLIQSFIAMPLPLDWSKLSPFERTAYFNGGEWDTEDSPRNEVTVAEIWVECLDKRREDMSRYNTREVNDILKMMGWRFTGSVKEIPHYGRQRIFKKV